MAGKEGSLLVADEGTTNAKAFVFSDSGLSSAVSRVEVRSSYPSPGMVEQDPRELWESQVRALRAAASKVPSNSVVGLAITNQRETLLVWDSNTGESLHNAIVWQDRRGASVIEGLEEEQRAMLRQKTGLIPDAYFSASKLAWLLDSDPGLREKALKGDVKFGTVDSYLVWKLTGGAVYATDSSNASRTMLMNVRTLEWDDEILAMLRIPAGVLPEIRASAGDYGEVGPKILGRTIPIAGVAGDQQAALLGHAALDRGDVKCTFGTGSFVLMNTGSSVVRSRNLLSTVAWTIGKKTTYAVEGSVLSSGSSIRWLIDGAGLASSVGEVERIAKKATSSGGVFFVPALSGLGAPYWDPYARGLLIGMTHGTTKREILRASVESIGFQTKDIVDEMSADSGRKVRRLKVDGGATESDFMLQVVSDTTGISVERPEFFETTARGAAFLAGLQLGLWKLADLPTLVGRYSTFHPKSATDEREGLYRGWKEAVRRSLGWEQAARSRRKPSNRTRGPRRAAG